LQSLSLFWLAAKKFTLQSAFQARLRTQAGISLSAESDSGALPLKTPPKGTQSPLETHYLLGYQKTTAFCEAKPVNERLRSF